jgi:hypothetical protein
MEGNFYQAGVSMMDPTRRIIYMPEFGLALCPIYAESMTVHSNFYQGKLPESAGGS